MVKFQSEESYGLLSPHDDKKARLYACIESKQLFPFWCQELFLVFLLIVHVVIGS